MSTTLSNVSINVTGDQDARATAIGELAVALQEQARAVIELARSLGSMPAAPSYGVYIANPPKEG